jgi:hypothetical protein
MGTAPMIGGEMVGGGGGQSTPGTYTAPPRTGGQNTTYAPPPLSACPPGMYRYPNGSCGPVGSPTPATPPVAQPVVSDWRLQLTRFFQSAFALIMSLPAAVLAQLNSIWLAIAPTVGAEIDSLLRALGDPTKSDADVANKIKSVNDSYRSMRPTLPGPAVRILDPIADGTINLVPVDSRPPGLVSPVAPGSVFDSVPWGWVAVSFIAGMFTTTLLPERSPKPTPNRRHRRRR